MNQNITGEELKNYEELIDIGNEEKKPVPDELHKLLSYNKKFSFFKINKLGKYLLYLFIFSIILIIIIYILFKYLYSYNATFKLIKVKNRNNISETAGNIIIETIKNNLNPKISLSVSGLPKKIYKYLIDKYEENEISFINTTFFDLYEYCGLKNNSKLLNSYYLKDNFLNHIDINEENIYLINTFGQSCEENAEKYKEILKQNEIDLQLINLEKNYNIGLNKPGISFDIKTHITQLSQNKRNEIAEMFDIEINEVPSEGITQGISDIINSKNILVVAEGKENAEIVKNIMKGNIDYDKPISALKNHVGIVYIIADEDACSLL